MQTEGQMLFPTSRKYERTIYERLQRTKQRRKVSLSKHTSIEMQPLENEQVHQGQG